MNRESKEIGREKFMGDIIMIKFVMHLDNVKCTKMIEVEQKDERHTT